MEQVLGSKTKISVLRLLCTYRKAFSEREIARRVGRNATNVHQVLQQLVDAGVVEAERVGRVRLFRIAESNLWVERVLVPLFEAERQVAEALASAVVHAAGPTAVSVVLFGSRARGESRAGSDVDLLVVVGSGEDPAQVRRRILDAGLHYGLSVEAVCVPVDDFPRWVWEAEDLWRAIEADGIVLAGRDIKELRGCVGKGAVEDSRGLSGGGRE